MRLFLLLLPLLLPTAEPPADDEPLQAVVVLTDGWDATAAVLQRYERSSPEAEWRAVGSSIDVMVGRTGLAWGRGVHGEVGDGPVKREGDGKAPAGIFRLGPAFGYAPVDSVSFVRLPYVGTDASVECVDDVRSRAYNRLVDRDTIAAPDWTSHEEMRRHDGIYRLGVWVDHNVAPVEPGGGSCIFLHIWRGPGVPTIGCTSMAAAELEALLGWLDSRARPVLVQAPRGEYGRLRAALDLPPI
jgi:L,D-peptidoglycan transpeptidase YkuD (ErfK/YbiS/YcfS/YnhG family)